MPSLLVQYNPINLGPFEALQAMAHNGPKGLFRLTANVMWHAGRNPEPHHVKYKVSPYSSDDLNVPTLEVTLETSAEPRDGEGKTPWDHRHLILPALARGISLPICNVATGIVQVILVTGGSNADIKFNASTGTILDVWNLVHEDFVGRRLDTL